VAHSASYQMGSEGSSPGVKRQGLEADHSPPTSAEVKKMWAYTSTPRTPSWRSAYLVNHRDSFTYSTLLSSRMFPVSLLSVYIYLYFLSLLFLLPHFSTYLLSSLFDFLFDWILVMNCRWRNLRNNNLLWGG
jgi:hypothetical protein